MKIRVTILTMLLTGCATLPPNNPPGPTHKTIAGQSDSSFWKWVESWGMQG